MGGALIVWPLPANRSRKITIPNPLPTTGSRFKNNPAFEAGMCPNPQFQNKYAAIGGQNAAPRRRFPFRRKNEPAQHRGTVEHRGLTPASFAFRYRSLFFRFLVRRIVYLAEFPRGGRGRSGESCVCVEPWAGQLIVSPSCCRARSLPPCIFQLLARSRRSRRNPPRRNRAPLRYRRRIPHLKTRLLRAALRSAQRSQCRRLPSTLRLQPRNPSPPSKTR